MQAVAPAQCAHETCEIRVRTNAAGAPMFKLQCLSCGSGKGEWISKTKIPHRAQVQPWDVELEQAGEEASRSEIRERQRQMVNEAVAKDAQWWAEYDAYLDSPEWRRKSRMVIQRDVMCQACLTEPAEQAHHLTYKHKGDEPLFDLVGVCRTCHEKITRMDREARQSA